MIGLGKSPTNQEAISLHVMLSKFIHIFFLFSRQHAAIYITVNIDKGWLIRLIVHPAIVINSGLVITRDLVIIYLSEHDLPYVILYCMYLVRQA